MLSENLHTEIRKFPRNTWRLVKLRERYFRLIDEANDSGAKDFERESSIADNSIASSFDDSLLESSRISDRTGALIMGPSCTEESLLSKLTISDGSSLIIDFDNKALD